MSFCYTYCDQSNTEIKKLALKSQKFDGKQSENILELKETVLFWSYEFCSEKSPLLISNILEALLWWRQRNRTAMTSSSRVCLHARLLQRLEIIS